MKAVVIGCVAFSEAMLSRLLALPGIEVAGVVTRGSSSFNADFRSLQPLAEGAGIPSLNADGGDQAAMASFMREIGPDVAFCVGWSRLLGPEILAIPNEGVIGYHPALLPRNRGRHPIIWALALGLEETGSSFFVMDEGADSGDVVSQRRVAIADDDDAASLYAKLVAAAGEQLQEIVAGLAAGGLGRTPQDPAQATYWRKRAKRDGEIDWRMPAAGIRNLVRALTRPYVGAHYLSGDSEVKVWRAEPAAASAQDVEPGRVLAADESGITVKCGDGAVTLIAHEFPKLPAVGECL